MFVYNTTICFVYHLYEFIFIFFCVLIVLNHIYYSTVIESLPKSTGSLDHITFILLPSVAEVMDVLFAFWRDVVGYGVATVHDHDKGLAVIGLLKWWASTHQHVENHTQ